MSAENGKNLADHAVLKSLFDLRAELRRYQDPRKMLINTMRHAQDLLGADAGAVAAIVREHLTTELIYSTDRSEEWNLGLLNDFIKRRRPEIPDQLVVARILRRNRPWGAIALRFHSRPDGKQYLDALRSITDALNEALVEFDDGRIRTLRQRIEHKIVRRQDPKDIIYVFLHGIRSLTRYDHSAAFLATQPKNNDLQLIAEQIAWTKAKSRKIGLRLTLNDLELDELARPGARLYRRRGKIWHNSITGKRSPVAECLDYNRGTDTGVRENAMVCAVIDAPDGTRGVLKISFQHSRSLGEFEAGLVDSFIPLISLTMQFMHSTDALKEQVLQAERKNVLASISRGIAHDVNNAFGAVLPLTQQLAKDVNEGRIEPETLSRDLETIESGLKTCRRIFSGMLALVRPPEDRDIGDGNVRRAIDGALNVVRSKIERHRIDVTSFVPSELSSVSGNQSDLTRVFLNLFTNAIDAMPGGGELTVSAAEQGDRVRIVVQDNGVGIPANIIERVTDSFFTTKDTGNGLGLSICRTIVWDMDGKFSIESQEGEGTKITLILPISIAEPGTVQP